MWAHFLLNANCVGLASSDLNSNSISPTSEPSNNPSQTLNPSSTSQGSGNKLDRAGQNTVTVVCTLVGVLAALVIGYWQTREGKLLRRVLGNLVAR
jgi:hypothetical protein